MKVAVKDANVFIDLESMGILDLWFQLDYHTMTSSFVVVELENGGHDNAVASIRAGQVAEGVISMEEMMGEFEGLRIECEPLGLSIADVSVIYLALREDAVLLSGDKPLRVFAKLRSVEVHGTLWIMDQLVESGTLVRKLAAQKLRTLLARTGREQRYLPRAECLTRIARWEKG